MLRKIAIAVQSDLGNKIHDQRIIAISDLDIAETDTYGWCVKIFRLKNISGGIELWIDKFPNVGRPILSICYYCGDLERIEKVANSSLDTFQDDHPYNRQRDNSGEWMLAKPLFKKYFGRFLIEPYQRKFFTCYFIDNLEIGERIPSLLCNGISKKTEWLLRSTVSALEIKSNTNEDYPTFENRKIISLHIRRERSKKLADAVKLRDGFTCRVCDFNFQDIYGELGRGFAEAHHIVALSKLRKNVKSTKDDLITVCSNCHRMLHKMDGQANDYKILKKRVVK